MSEQSIEKEIQDKGLNAPRLTPALIGSKVKLVAFFDTDTFKGLGEVDRELLKSQSEHMHQYLAVVDHRVSLYTPCNSAG